MESAYFSVNNFRFSMNIHTIITINNFGYYVKIYIR